MNQTSLSLKNWNLPNPIFNRYSSAWELPTAIRNKFKTEGKNLTDCFNEEKLCNDPKIGDKGGVLAIVTGGRITRPDYTVQSIQMALVAMNPDIYTCGPNVPKGINSPDGPIQKGAGVERVCGW